MRTVEVIDKAPLIRIRVNKLGVAEALDKPRGVRVTIVNRLHPRCSLDYPSDEEMANGAWPAWYEAKFLQDLETTVPAREPGPKDRILRGA